MVLLMSGKLVALLQQQPCHAWETRRLQTYWQSFSNALNIVRMLRNTLPMEKDQ